MENSFIILIPTYGRGSLLNRTLESISKCDFPEGYLKTLVVENGPKEGAEGVCKTYSHINCEYVHYEIANKSEALNFAINSLDSECYIIFFDDDIRVHPNILRAYYNAFCLYGNKHFYGGPLGVDYEKKPAIFYRSLLPISARGYEQNQKYPIDYFNLMGCNWASSFKEIKRVGGFEKKFGPNSTTGATGQEHNMMLRLISSGITPKYVSEAKVWHYVPKERSSLTWMLSRYYKGGINTGINDNSWDNKKLISEFLISMRALVKGVIKMKRSEVVKPLTRLYFLKGVRKGTLNK